MPRYFLPDVLLLDNSLFLSGLIGSHDPLERHNWFGSGSYRSDNRFVGYAIEYQYRRFFPTLFANSSLYSVNFGDLFASGANFYEKRWRGGGGFVLPWSSHKASLGYFYEDRSVQSGLPAGITLNTLGNYAGLFTQYRFSNLSETAAAISTERGTQITLNGELTNQMLGASDSLEQEVVWADGRAFAPLGGHHVLAFRAAGGAAFGDQLIQGNFGLGGSIGEGPFTGTSTRVFTLRGLPLVTFSRDRAWVASAEYRFPLVYIERGLGTLPLAVNAAHFALFADVGDAYQRRGSTFRPMLGVGGELRGEFVLGYYLPVTGRLGYGIIVTNRSRITGVGLIDPLTGSDVSNGILILELETSF